MLGAGAGLTMTRAADTAAGADSVVIVIVSLSGDCAPEMPPVTMMCTPKNKINNECRRNEPDHAPAHRRRALDNSRRLSLRMLFSFSRRSDKALH